MCVSSAIEPRASDLSGTHTIQKIPTSLQIIDRKIRKMTEANSETRLMADLSRFHSRDGLKGDEDVSSVDNMNSSDSPEEGPLSGKEVDER